MTVKDLIEILSKLELSAPVYVPNGEMPDEYLELSGEDVKAVKLSPVEWNGDIHAPDEDGSLSVIIE